MAKEPVTAEAGAPDQVWHARAERVAGQVLSEVQDGADALPAVSLLEAVLRAEDGTLPAGEAADLDEFFRREEDPESGCICPPGLLARGGFRGCCPVHAAGPFVRAEGGQP